METNQKTSLTDTDNKLHVIESRLAFRALTGIADTVDMVRDLATATLLAQKKISQSLDIETEYTVQLKSEIVFLRGEIEFWKSFAIENVRKVIILSAKNVETTEEKV
jgi:hypothetical protein